MPKRSYLLMFLIFACAGILLGEAGSPSSAEEPASADAGSVSQPDLNLLQKRVLEFWSLLKQGRKAKALEYVQEEGREHFLNWRVMPIQSFHVREIRLEEDFQAAVVQVEFVVTAPGLGTVPWPREQRWVLQDSNWYLRVEQVTMARLFGGSTTPKPPPPDTPEKAAVLSALRRFNFAARRFDLGRLKEGEVVWKEIAYRNPTDLMVTVRIDQAPPWAGFDKSRFEVAPGEEGKLLFGVFTHDVKGALSGKVAVVISHGEVKLTQEFIVEGTVIAPLTVVPGYLVLAPDSSHSVIVRNNTDQPVEIRDLYASASFIRARWASGVPTTIGPNSEAILEVGWDPAQAPEDWTAGQITVLLAPASGETVSLPILVLRRLP